MGQGHHSRSNGEDQRRGPFLIAFVIAVPNIGRCPSYLAGFRTTALAAPGGRRKYAVIGTDEEAIRFLTREKAEAYIDAN